MVLYNKHYIRTNGENNIIHGFSDAFPDDPRNQVRPEDICINEQGGRQFEILIDGEQKTNFSEWSNPQGIYLYRWINNAVYVKTPQEIEAETPPTSPLFPSIEERLKVTESAVLALMMGGASHV